MTNITEMLAPKGTHCRPGHAMTPLYITVHNTANTSKGAGAISHGKYLQSAAGSAKYVSYHYAVDDKNIVHIVPTNEASWHAGDGENGMGNRKSIGIEICENPESNLLTATNNAAELVAHLMRDYKIPISRVVQHHNWTGKNCPNRIRKGEPYNWATFKARVEAYYAALFAPVQSAPQGTFYTVQTGAFKKQANAQAYRDALKEKNIACFIVQGEDKLYHVQAGAFSKIDNAQAYAEALTKNKVKSFVCKKEVD